MIMALKTANIGTLFALLNSTLYLILMVYYSIYK